MTIKKGTINSDETIDNKRKIDTNIILTVEYYDDEDKKTSNNKKIKFDEYMKNWLYNFNQNTIKPSSFDRKEGTVKNQILPYIGEYYLHELNADNIQEMIKKQLENGYSYSSIKKSYEVVNQCLEFAFNRNDIDINFMKAVCLPKKFEKLRCNIKYFNEEEVKTIEKEAVELDEHNRPRYTYGALIVFLLNTGLRISEALALCWSDINYEKSYVKIRKNIVSVKNREAEEENSTRYISFEQDSSKTKNSTRIVPLNKKAIKALDLLKNSIYKSDYIVCRENGHPCSSQMIYKNLKRILKRCNIPASGLHILRHTFASQLFNKGVDPKLVSELLGHSRVSITYDIYIHLIQEQRIIAVEELDKLL